MCLSLFIVALCCKFFVDGAECNCPKCLIHSACVIGDGDSETTSSGKVLNTLQNDLSCIYWSLPTDLACYFCNFVVSLSGAFDVL